MKKLSKKQRNAIYRKVQEMFDKKSIHTPYICHCVAKTKGLFYSAYDKDTLMNELPETKLFFDNPHDNIMNAEGSEQLDGVKYWLQKAIVSDLLVLMTNPK